MNRRGFLVTGATAALAGCLGGDGGPGETPDDGSSGGDGNAGDGGGDGSGADGPTLDIHPSATALAAQPALGPDPGSATATIVNFEDPSCPICGKFEREIVPRLRSNLVEPGDLSLVVRGYPIIYEWGKPATRALEATYDADEDAFWQLHGHYFAEQSAFRSAGADEVYPRTESFLEAETGVDAAAVVGGARDGEYEAAVQTDLDAGSAAGASATPSLFYFRDGRFLTKTTGSISYATIASILQV
ncbi:DsbA family protein [Halobacteriales archaeon Cl-PHB]